MRSFITALAVGIVIASTGLIQGCHKGDDEKAPGVGEYQTTKGEKIPAEAQAILDKSKNGPKEPSPFQKGPPK
jgi:hypothetical protein